MQITIKDHEIAQLVSSLTKIAVQYKDTQQLRARISSEVLLFIEQCNKESMVNKE